MMTDSAREQWTRVDISGRTMYEGRIERQDEFLIRVLDAERERVKVELAEIAKRIHSYVGNLNGIEDDPIYQAVLAVHRSGFEAAHELRKCGHSVGDWRDPNYDPCNPEATPYLECKCVGCAREEKLQQRVKELEDVLRDEKERRQMAIKKLRQWSGEIPSDYGPVLRGLALYLASDPQEAALADGTK